MNADAARLLGLLGLIRIDNGDILGATTLGVLVRLDALGARVAVLAVGAVGHAVVKLEVAVELDIDVNLTQGEVVKARVALLDAEPGS